MVPKSFYLRFLLLNFLIKLKKKTQIIALDWYSNFEMTSYRKFLGR